MPLAIARGEVATGASDEWRAHWPLVVASMIGISQIALAIYTLGLFMEPLSKEFGWSRTQVSSGITMLSCVAIPLGPFVGNLIDRFGPRRLALPGLILQGLAFAAFALLSGSIAQWLFFWLLFALATQLVNTPVWSAAVTSVFHKSRGLALAVMMCGTALGSAIAPPLTQYLIAQYGWRTAFVTLGLGWAGAMLLVTIPFFYGAQDRRTAGSADTQAATTAALPGLSFAQALRDASLTRIALTLLMLSGLFGSLIVHLVPILTATGLSRATAAGLIPVLALAGLVGKLVTGWLLDNLPVAPVAGLTFGIGLLPCLGLWLAGGSIPILIACVALLGWAMSSYLQASAYLISRYAGPRSFGLIFGSMMSVMAVSTGVGPMLAGYVYDRSGSYDLLFLAGAIMTVVAGLLMATIRRYPDWDPQS